MAIAEACPPLKSPQWKQFESIVGEDGAYRMWLENGADDAALDMMAQLLDPVTNPISDKQDKLREQSKLVEAERGTDAKTGERLHKYWTKSVDGKGKPKELVSVSRVLDGFDDTAYQGHAVGSVYADNGSSIHLISELLIDKPSGDSDQNIIEQMKRNGVPDEALPQVKDILRELRKEGVLVSEITLGDEANGYAGTSDIVRLRFDGGIDIIDIKTAHKTPSTKGKIWDPVGHFGGYKARRYPAQIEFYKRLVEKALGQPVSNAFIIPIEITYKNDSPAEGMETVNILPLENVDDYGYKDRAKEIVDEFFGKTPPVVETDTEIGVDDSTDFLEALSGSPEGRITNLQEQAERIRINAYMKRGTKYYKAGDQEFPLRGNDPAVHRQQIIDQYLRRKDKAQRNMVNSILNYIRTGEDRFLDDPGEHNARISQNIKDWLKIYDKNVKVYNLNSVKGFKNKDGWIVFQQNDVLDILYLGAEELDQRITMKGSGVFGNRENLFGDYFTNAQAKQFLGSDLKNNRRDAKKLEGAMIAMQLKSVMPEVSFERAFVYSSYDASAKAPSQIQLRELLPILQKVSQRKEFKDIIPRGMAEIFANEESFNVDNYRQNYIKAWQDYIQANELAKERKILNKAVNQYTENRDNLLRLEDLLGQQITTLKRKRDAKYDQELYLLAQAYFELRGINTDINPIDVFRKITSMPTNIRNAIVADVVYETNSQLNNFKENYWEGYKKPSEETYKNLFKASGITSKASNLIMADTTRMYNPLMKKKVFTTAKDGREVELPTFELIEEGTKEFEQLNPAQKAFIKMFNDNIQEGAKKAGLDWVRGRIPLVKKTAMRQLGEALKGNVSREAMNDLFENHFNENFIFTSRNLQDNQKVINLFNNQSNTNMSDPRLERLGISPDDNVNLGAYQAYETNLEVILDMFMINANKVVAMEKAGRIFDAANALMNFQKANFFNEKLGDTIDWLETWEGGMLNNQDRRPREGREYETKLLRIIKPANALTSLGIIGFNPKTALVATLGQEFTLLSKSIGNSYADEGLFDWKAWGKAHAVVMNPFERNKIAAIVEQYKLFDMDINSLSSSQRRFIDKGVANTKNAYIMLRWGDYMTRSKAMVAQMIHDGSWDAYELVDGKLVYNELIDSRFNGQGRYTKEEGKALKEAIKVELAKKGHLSKDGRMLRAYDERLAQKHKHVADTTFGGMDKETRGFWNYVWAGKLLGIFKSWLPARIDAMTKKPGTSLFDGDYRMQRDESGEMYATWEGDIVEGYMYTLAAMWFNTVNYLKRSETKPLTKQQKGNVARMSADLSMIMLGYLTASAVAHALQDDDDAALGEEATTLLQRSLQDVAVTYNLLNEATGLFQTPAALNYLLKAMRATIGITTGDTEKFIELAELTPARAYIQMYEIL